MNQAIPIGLNLLAGIFGALGQYLYKRGAARLGALPVWENWQLALGVSSFCVVMALFVLSYKLGGRISVVFPAYATTFLWGALLGHYLEGEPLNPTILAGIALILVGVTAVGIGGLRP
jgi:drug/metabolite transporter (DMT)-like permease